MTHTRCPSCICGFDATTERKGVPSVKVIQNMVLNAFVDLMNDLGVIYNLEGTQEIVLGGNLDRICQQKRATFIKKLITNRVILSHRLSSQAIEELGC